MGSGPNWYQIGNKTCDITKVSKLHVEKKDIYVNRTFQDLQNSIRWGNPFALCSGL